jgi:hypothetical protein
MPVGAGATGEQQPPGAVGGAAVDAADQPDVSVAGPDLFYLGVRLHER